MNKFKLEIIDYTRIYHFIFRTKRDMNLAMMRISEFQDSPHKQIKGQYFTYADFLEAYVDEDGKLDYFNYWEGHNFTKELVLDFYEKFKVENTFNEVEALVIQVSQNSQDYHKKVFIAHVEGDHATFNHEEAHAKFYFNETYKDAMIKKFSQVRYELLEKITSDLNLRYGSSVIVDETQAYFTTADDTELIEMFPSLTYLEILEVKDHYRA
jgi:hypothetical protein